MRVALVCNNQLPVFRYGGTERVVEWMGRELIQQGHQVTLIAPAGSAMDGATIVFANSREACLHELNQRKQQIDVVHFHGWYGDFDAIPNVSTLHGNMQAGEKLAKNLICISADHARRHGRQTFVYNGLPLDSYQLKQEKSNHYLYLSKVRRRNKGCDEAMRLACQFDLDLHIAGGSRLDLIKLGWFWRSWQRRFKVFGEVGGVQKQTLLQEAKAMLFPIRWNEPFGLAVVESMLCGTPVLATPMGSMTEIVQTASDGGALFSNDEEFERALAHVNTIKPADCRAYAESRFSIGHSVRAYVTQYERVLSGETLL